MIFKYSKLLLIIIEKATVIPPIDIGQAHSRRNIRGFCIEYISILLNEEEREETFNFKKQKKRR